MQVKKQQLELDMEKNGLFQTWERSASRLYIVTLLFKPMLFWFFLNFILFLNFT